MQTVAGHAIKTTDGIDILKAVINRGDFAQINLRAVPRCQQHDALKVLPVIGLAPGLHADVTVDAFNRTRRQVQ